MVTPGVAASVGQLIEEGGARLVVVMGHSQCAAADKAVDAWLEHHREANAWPWATSAATAAMETHEQAADSLPHVDGWQPAASMVSVHWPAQGTQHCISATRMPGPLLTHRGCL